MSWVTTVHVTVGLCGSSDASAFCRALVSNGYLTEAQMQHAAQRYRLGVSRDGGVIFWQIDTTGSILDGKIMYYRPDCHRDHKRHPQWVSNRLKHYYLGDDVELIASIPSYHCLFGTHLLMEDARCKMADVFPQTSSFRLHTSDVAVVEAEKTAVILSEHYPAYLWLAYEVAREARRLYGCNITVSPLLELSATPEQKQRKIDLVDYLFKK